MPAEDEHRKTVRSEVKFEDMARPVMLMPDGRPVVDGEKLAPPSVDL